LQLPILNRNKEPDSNDLNRLRIEYSQRDQYLSGRVKYSPFDHAHLFNLQSRQKNMLSLLRKTGFTSLEGLNILDLGCGYGETILTFLNSGASPESLYGCDLIYYRLTDSTIKTLNFPLANADGQNLPFPDGSFDLVFQGTVFTSILDPKVRSRIANEMIRVRKKEGIIIWYDFWLNPANKQVRGIRPREIKQLFPGCRFSFRRITLAPPITRRLVKISWSACTILESLKIFNSHYLGVIFNQ
jgi:SAM-dependent methyltransferase